MDPIADRANFEQMMRGKRALRDSQAPSPEGSEDDEARSPISNDGEIDIFGLKTPPLGSMRGRKGKNAKGDAEEPKREAMDVMH